MTLEYHRIQYRELELWESLGWQLCLDHAGRVHLTECAGGDVQEVVVFRELEEQQ